MHDLRGSRPSTRRPTSRACSPTSRRGPSCGPAAAVVVVDDGSTDDTVAVVAAYDGPLPVEVLVQPASNQGPGRAFDRGFRARARALRRRRRPDRHARGRHDERPRRARARCSPRRRAGADIVLASRARRRRSSWASAAAAPRSRAPPSSSSAAAPASTRAPSRRSSASTARGSCAAATSAYGDALIRERGFACKAEILAKLDRARRPRRRGPGRRWTPRGARARASCGSCPTVARLRAPHGAPGRRPQGVGARMSAGRPSVGDRRRRPRSACRRATAWPQAGVAVTSTSATARSAASPGQTDLGGIPVDRYYHVVLPTDDRVRGLAEELGLGDRFRFRHTGVGFYHDGRADLDVLAARAADLPGPAAARPQRGSPRSSPAAS